jgi:predicted  nucleic acid-binding Zn-ribbon protein
MTNEIDLLKKMISKLADRFAEIEKWCIQHEKEGMDYGNEFEERDDKIQDNLAELSERINIIGDAVLALNKRIEDLPPIEISEL